VEPSIDATQDTPPTTPDAITLTAVHIGPDGAPQITRRTLTATQRAAFDPAAITAARTAPHPAGGVSAHGVFDDDPCVLSSVYLYDQVNFGGNVLCIVGNGTFELSDFIYDWELHDDGFGNPFWLPIPWAGKAASAWVTFSAGEFYSVARGHVLHLDPQSGNNFIKRVQKGWVDRFPPDSVVIE
jgi:hypothetical protein